MRGYLAAIAGLGLAIAFISQSVGAILLLFIGLTLLWTISLRLTRRLLAFIVLLMALGGAIYFSGVVPFGPSRRTPRSVGNWSTSSALQVEGRSRGAWPETKRRCRPSRNIQCLAQGVGTGGDNRANVPGVSLF